MRKITAAAAAICTVLFLYGCGPLSDEIDVRPDDGLLAGNNVKPELVTETVTVQETEQTSPAGKVTKMDTASSSVRPETKVSETSSEVSSSDSDSSGSSAAQNNSDNPSQENRHQEDTKPSDEPANSREQQKPEETQAPVIVQEPEETESPVTEEPSKAPVSELPPAPVESNPELKYADGILIVNKSYSLPEDYVPELVTAYGTWGELLTPETNSAFRLMRDDASREGYSLTCASGYRSYSLQDSLYTRYSARDGRAAADTYSARPGHSEHQTGLALDLNTIEDSFAYTGEGKWVAANCWRYGFIVRYPKGKEDITGYKYEPWHIRYVGTELAGEIYNSGLTLEEYFGLDSRYSD